jgi:hypothetical protein
MLVIGERQFNGGNAGVLQAEKAIYPLNMESFRLSDKCRIIDSDNY